MIRQLTGADVALWKEIRLEAVKMHPEAFFGSYEEESVRSDNERIERLENSPVFVFMQGDTAAAVAGYYREKGLKRMHRGTVVTVYTRPAFRGKNIMGQLLRVVEEHARAEGIEQLHLGVYIKNISAIRCYEKQGYTHYAVDPRSVKLNGEYLDEYQMLKYL